MSHGQLGKVLGHLRRLLAADGTHDLTDAQLLERFTGRRDESAFRALVQRHGPLVLSVCRRVLRDPHAADDAFQATFLVLLRRAASLRRGALAGWLYGVAYRVAMRARATQHQRQARQQPTDDLDAAAAPVPDPGAATEQRDLVGVLDDELQRLPAKYREPLVLCYLQGKTNEEAARELGWPTGSMSRHLARGRELLHRRLAQRGVAVPALLLGAALAPLAPAAVPAALEEALVQAALHGRFPGPISEIANEILREMSMKKLHLLAAVLLTVGTAGLGLSAFPGDAPPPAPVERAAPAPAAEPRVVWKDLQLTHDWLVAGLALSPDGKQLATADGDGLLHLWELPAGKEVCTLGTAVSVLHPKDGIERKIHRDRLREQLAQKKMTAAERVKLEEELGSLTVPQSIAFVPGGQALLTWGKKGPRRMELWDIATGRETRSWEAPQDIQAAVVSPDGKLIGAGCQDTTVCLWDTATGKEVRRFTAQKTKGGGASGAKFFSLTFSADGKLLATGSGTFEEKRNGVWLPISDTVISLWDTTTGDLLRTCEKEGNVMDYRSIVFSPDGRYLAAGCGIKIVLWDTATGKRAQSWKTSDAGGPRLLVFAPDGRTLASLTADNRTIRLWDFLSACEVSSWEGHSAVAFSPDGRAVAWASRDGTAFVRPTADIPRKEVPAGALLDAPVLAVKWDTLAGTDGPLAFEAATAMVRTTSGVEAFLKERLRPVQPADPARIRQFVADLDSPQFAVRQKATDELEKVGDLAVFALREALAEPPSLEKSKRLRTLLMAAEDVAASPERLRGIRAVTVLEQRGTPEARELLRRLADGAQGASGRPQFLPGPAFTKRKMLCPLFVCVRK